MTQGRQEVNRLTFLCTDGGRFEIGPEALSVMHRYGQDTPGQKESGGVLLGRHILANSDIVIDRVTTPMLGDRRGRFWFFRARRQHQEAIDRAWKDSDGTCTYLGEWHTHPQKWPVPSVVDWVDWQRRLLFDRFVEPIFFVIVGHAEIRVWQSSRYGRFARLQQL